MCQLILAYTVMLLVMTWQVLVLFVVLTGVAIGYFVSNPAIMKGMDKLYIKELEQSPDEEKSLEAGKCSKEQTSAKIETVLEDEVEQLQTPEEKLLPEDDQRESCI